MQMPKLVIEKLLLSQGTFAILERKLECFSLMTELLEAENIFFLKILNFLIDYCIWRMKLYVNVL